MSRPVVTKHLWAPIAIGMRTEWVIWPHVKVTRREAKASYLEQFDPKFHKEVLRGVRFARVTIIEETE